MPFADGGKQAVEASEDFSDGFECSGALRIVNQLRDLRCFDRSVFAVSLDVYSEVLITIRIRKAVILLQSLDLLFRHRWNLALIGIKSAQTHPCPTTAAART